MIPQDVIDRIRETVDIAQVLGQYIRLKKRGRNFEARCPFHTEKTPSFKVNANKQIYHCFGCGKGGNVFTFLMEHERMSFVEAVKHLAPRANVVIREERTDVRREEVERLSYAQQVAMEYFEQTLREPKLSFVLDDYLRKRRGISDESIALFHLGLAADSWEGLIGYASRKGLKPPELVEAGLAIHNENKNSHFDRFRQRLMIPIFNLSNSPIAFGGRTLKKGEPAKYINSPETRLYHKSNVLYGLNHARDEIRTLEYVYVVEGYFDVISLWQAGVKNVVASSGTAFTAQQARLLARFANHACLFFDADSAGQTAALRSVDALYDAGLEVSIMVPPPGEDPDSVARQFGRDRIEQLREEAQDFIQFRVKNVDLSRAGIIEKEKLVKEMSSLAARLSDPTRRTLFLQQAAEALRVEPTIFDQIKAKPEPANSPAGLKERHNRFEFEFLSLLLENPGNIDQVLEEIAVDDFDSKKLSRMYSAMSVQYSMDGLLNTNRLIENFKDEESISLITELGSFEWDREQTDREVALRLKEFSARKQKKIRKRLQRELAEAEANGDQQKASEILEQIRQYSK